MVALAKKKKLTIGSSGFGSNHQLVGEMLKQSAGIDLTHVPYKGFGNAVVDAVACNVDLLPGAISSGIPHVRGGKLKALAVTGDKRHPGLPDTPTFAEAGHPAVAMDAYFGMLAVDPARQGQGLGRALVDAAEDYARTAGCRDMDIRVVNLRAELPPFYRKLGYREIGTEPGSDPRQIKPFHFVTMSKPIS